MEKNVKPKHICEHCGKSFPYKSKLIIHQSLHLPQDQRKLFICSLCKKGFRLKENLKKHLRTHIATKLDLDMLWGISKFVEPNEEMTAEKFDKLHKQRVEHEKQKKDLIKEYKIKISMNKRKQWCWQCGNEAIFPCCW